jgi:hypothetical protein
LRFYHIPMHSTCPAHPNQLRLILTIFYVLT